MEIPRTRDVVTLVKGSANPVLVTSGMAAAGWPGGQGVTWVNDPTGDDFLVDFSDGTYGGFLLWGSNEAADQFIAYTQNQPTYKYAICCTGVWIVTTATYEKYTLQSRLSGPLVPNTYTVGTRLRFSLRGLFTPQDEWTITGDPRAPNDLLIAQVVQVPSSLNNNYLMVQTSI
jgi:hypothetical protein